MLFGLSIGFGILMGKAVKALHSDSSNLESQHIDAEVNATPLEKTLLWKIEGKEIAEPSYLFGTIHLFPEEKYFLPEPTQKAMAATQRVTFEMDFTDQAQAMESLQYINMDEGQTIDQLFSEAEYKTLTEWVKAATGAGIENFNTWHPMMLSTLFMKDFIDGPTVQYERKLLELAKANEQEMTGLETAKEQVQALTSIAVEDQVKYIREMIVEKENMKQIFQEMVSMYQQQDIESLNSMIIESSGGDAFVDKLLYQRNHNWVERIQTLAEEKPTFFAVGSGHIAGDQGLVLLLREAGFTVTPVMQ